ncbi:MAG: PHP domain-containing protein [Acetobacter sp.]|nr:PHP domain-containing protein [Bacteroides sp.]MCM1340310.1 PHP domain-containing protein [Acetobacter sp.]MCM1433043.1 PHP domain-containing protein [Clostridiales bacterium]
MAADLHCHTKLSDGSVGIEDLIVIAQKSGINTIAITDHDCLAGTVRGQVIGKRYGVEIIPGVELSAFDYESGKKVHILSYLADKPDRLEGLCKRTSVARKRAGQIMMLKVAARFPITTDFIINHASGSTNLFKQHIMHALMDAGYTDEIFGDLYNALFSRESETNLLAPVKYPDVKEVISEVHEAGGIAVLAHPAVYDNFDEIENYIELGLDGIEVWHPSASDETIETLSKTCKNHKLLMTGGSDFHGIYGGKAITLGSCSTPDIHLDKLKGYKAKKKRAQRKAEKAKLAEEQ